MAAVRIQIAFTNIAFIKENLHGYRICRCDGVTGLLR